jgi:hypothetical protein
MHIMKSRSFRIVSLGTLLAGVFLVSWAGCSRPPAPRPQVPPPPPVETDVFRDFAERVRYPENPRISDDWTRIHLSLQQLAGWFAREDVSARMRLKPEERKFLEDHAHLSGVEMAEVEAPAFRTADAHYLDECYLLRAAARSVELKYLDPVAQAQLYFQWVMRNILLHEQVDTWIPPAFALRRGHASAVDRALVFLALLRQARGDGCLIVVKGSEPLQFLVAVHDVKGKSLRLFDPRLEMPVRGKDGKSIATLDEVRAEPALLAPSGITKEDAEKFEARLVCPLLALAPRMRELEKGLSGADPIVLHLPADALQRLQGTISALTKGKMEAHIWNAKADTNDKGIPPNSPTRALRLFLSKQDGGIDETGRALAVATARVPLHDAVANYASLGLLELLPRPTLQTLEGVTQRLFLNYDVQTRELYLRGQHAALAARQERLLGFARNDTLVGLAQDQKFREELGKWLPKLRADYANLGDAKGDQMLQAIWAKDELLDYLLDVDKAMKIDPSTGRPVRDLLFEATTKTDPNGQTVTEMKVRVTTRIIAVGVRDYFHNELARSQAAVSHEKAELLHADLRAGGKPGEAAQRRADEAWILAKGAWGNFIVERIAPVDLMIRQRLARIREPLRIPDLTAHRIHMLETLHLDVQKYFQARLRYAGCLPHIGNDGAQKAREYLERTKLEIDEIQKNGALAAEIKKLAAELPPSRPALQKRLDLLANDWSERGNYSWIKRQIDERLKAGH